MKTFIQLALLLTLLAPGAQAQVSERQLRDAVADAVAAHPDLVAGARIELSHVRAADAGVLARAHAIERVEFARGQKPIGLVTLRVWLDVPSDPGVWTWVRARSRALVPTVVMIREVARGAILSRADVEVVHKSPHPQTHADAAQVVGLRTRRTLKSGEMVLSAWLDVAPLVHRGDHLVAAIHRRGLEVRTPAIALESGGSGEMIKVRIPATGRVVHGRILSARQVEVMP